jgi:1-deoxy-D-xylulose-5-phosphate reductoisomerase
MSSTIGLSGLEPTLDIVQCTKRIAIANKESIICGWSLIKKKLKKYNTKFIPIDSEHFSIFELIKNEKINNIKKIYITASGGPFLNIKKSKLNKFVPKNAIKHPTWKMGKKISVDSSTLINKVYELIEAKKIFNLDYDKFEIIIQPTSYVHAIVEFNNGISKILTHPTSMKIPIYNSLLFNSKISNLSENIDIDKINNLNFQKIDKSKFPVFSLLNKLENLDSLFETVLVASNDVLVELFLKEKIKFFDIYKILNKILSLKEYKRYKFLKPQNLNQITKLSENVRLKTLSLSVQSKI